MKAAQNSLAGHREQWFDNSWWDGQLGTAIATPDPALVLRSGASVTPAAPRGTSLPARRFGHRLSRLA